MSVVEAPPTQLETTERSPGRSVGTFLRDSEIDTRMVGMMVVLVVIWIGFHIISGGTFLTPRNLWNLSVQTSSVGIMATGMVLVIVSRNIDLSVGSMVGVVGMVMALLQAEILPDMVGSRNQLDVDRGPGCRPCPRRPHRRLSGCDRRPRRGSLFHRHTGRIAGLAGFAWLTASGRTIAPMDATFQLLGGGSRGSLGETGSWVVGGIACLGIIAFLFFGRRRRRKFGFRLRPMWLDATLGVFGCAVVLAAVWVTNSYYLPENLAGRWQKKEAFPGPKVAF